MVGCWVDIQKKRRMSWMRCLLVLSLVIFEQAGAPTAPEDLQALKEIYVTTRGTHWREGFSWQYGMKRNLDPCDDNDYFKGLTCNGQGGDPNRKVVQMWLSAVMLNGTLPPTLGQMDQMIQLFVTYNNLTGPIPTSVCNMTQLTHFEVSQNHLNGSIPDCIDKLANLQKWESRSNLLTGTIPANFGKLAELQGLFLSDNLLSGTVPPELFNSKRIEQLMLSYNRLEGTIPKIFSRYKIKENPSMQGLSWMDTRANKLQGTYPDIMAVLAAV